VPVQKFNTDYMYWYQ